MTGSERGILIMGPPMPRAQTVAYRSERLLVTRPNPAHDCWMIEDIGVVSLLSEKLIAAGYLDRRKAGRKIRQARRRLRRINRKFGHKPGTGVPEFILRATVARR